MNAPRTALIIGGGIAGPAAAMALQKAGIESVVYEARPAGADRQGAFLTVGSNGLDALAVLDADTAARTAGFATPWVTLRSGTGKRLGRSRISRSGLDGTPSHTIKRAGLYRLLRAEASRRGVRVEYGKRLVSAEETGDGVRAVFADGSEATGDLLIGCDGVHSTVRRIIDAGAPDPTYVGLLNTGGFAQGVNVGTEPGSYEMIFGKRAFFGYVAAPDGQVWWFANVPCRDAPTRDETYTPSDDDRRRELLHLLAEDAGPAVSLIEATREVMPLSPIHYVPHLPTWRTDRMVLLGDAAHAPSPSSGQGASLSIEDAVVLAKSLRDLPNPREALAHFEAARRPRVERIIKAAARVNSSKAAGPVARVLRDAMLPVVLKLTADSKAQKEVYDYHVDWDAPMPQNA
jgi:FAD-dependent urate hydroxylase